MSTVRALTPLALIATPVASTAAPLWQRAESGMTTAEIRSLFPEASAPTTASTLHSGARCELAIENYEVASSPYGVCFYFFGGKLTQVALTGLEPNLPRFEGVVDLLRSKYGPELGAGQPLCKPGTLKICEAKWALKSGTNISALFMQVGNNKPLVTINYQTHMADEASKL